MSPQNVMINVTVSTNVNIKPQRQGSSGIIDDKTVVVFVRNLRQDLCNVRYKVSITLLPEFALWYENKVRKNVETFKTIKNMFDLMQTVREDLNPSIS